MWIRRPAVGHTAFIAGYRARRHGGEREEQSKASVNYRQASDEAGVRHLRHVPPRWV
jgi:hypothetical protein